MKRICLQMIFLGSLLIFNNQSASFTTAAAERCISKGELKNRTDRFQRKYSDRVRIPAHPEQQPSDTRTCAQMAKEIHNSVANRSLSPWKYEVNRDDSRVPDKISFAKCLCEGCIINGHEDLTYNSVLVYAELMVLKKRMCSYHSERYVVKKEVIQVPVACTCVVPKYAKQ